MNAWLAMALCLWMVADTWEECPSVCECKWRSGKESVVCANSNLTHVPRQLDSGTQLLDLTGNTLDKIDKDEFYKASLLNLQKIYLSKCRIKTVDRCSFRNIINLVELDLSFNELQTIPSHTFEFIKDLRELRLNGNPIIRILNNSFKMVPNLTKLDLSECKIAYVEIRAFQGLENSLEWLKLDNNKISNVKSVTLVQLGNLHGLELSSNPWNCSCGLRPLREWILRHNIPYTITPMCKWPTRLSGRLWDKLDLDEFACLPRIEAVKSGQSGVEGNNVTMSCTVSGTPEPSVQWLRKNHVIANLSSLAVGSERKLYVVQVGGHLSNLTIMMLDLQDNGVYTCRAENKAGRSEASIALAVTLRPELAMWSTKVMLASVAVAVLSLLAAALLVLCACNFRKRQHGQYHRGGQHVAMNDAYEMNHKTEKPLKYANNYVNSAKVEIELGTGHQAKARNGRYRGVPTTDEDMEDLSAPTPITVGRESRIWSSLRLSDPEESEPVQEEVSDRRISPDLHIPRLKNSYRGEYLTSEAERGVSDVSSSQAETERRRDAGIAAQLLSSTPGVKSHIMHKQTVGSNGGTLYTTALPSEVDATTKYPDLLELSLNDKNAVNNNSFCTLPRKRTYKTKRSRHNSCGSESPLLPGSSGGSDSCDSSYSSNRRLSADTNLPTKNSSLPTSPRNLTPTPLLNLLDNTVDLYTASSPATYDYKSSELEKFLKEYRNLQEQLYKMKESCENLKEDNLRFNESRARSIENNTISRLIDPVYKSTGHIEPMYSVTQQIINDTNNMESVYTDSMLQPEDNNNPKSILKNKPCANKSVLESFDFKSDSYWMSRDKLFNYSEPTQDGEFFES